MITSTVKPRWYQLRWKLSNALANLARRIYPSNPDVMAFYMQVVTDYMISGRAVTRIDPSEFYKES